MAGLHFFDDTSEGALEWRKAPESLMVKWCEQSVSTDFGNGNTIATTVRDQDSTGSVFMVKIDDSFNSTGKRSFKCVVNDVRAVNPDFAGIVVTEIDSE